MLQENQIIRKLGEGSTKLNSDTKKKGGIIREEL